ncbi:response regulator transcription factor [Mastigocoleus sp. MO_188.B34]|uniref:response regulator transcription factor n=1 Tax=Mastigocoleus sp. MO_188.B34 TaxID=3036635 RepID=UPI002638CA18|nr:response regulator transcription factor [Mastigocoleus sp. MO_188.B34]MDJ0692890.1 response regulator transcription factor [Mastigocoleus sp. MO_188.B34]
MRILIVEDDDRISRPLAEDLRNQHHVVDIARDGVEGWEYSQAAEYDLILLDLMLPRLDGISLCKRLRDTQSKVLILILTAKDTTTDKVVGLDAGADDYLIKPFELEELAARIRALCRRSREIQQPILSHNYLQLNPTTHRVTYKNKIISLTPKEYLILEYFLRHPEQVVTPSILLDKLWELDKSSGEGTIKTHITNLRNKIKAAGKTDNFIENVYGVGYRLSSD